MTSDKGVVERLRERVESPFERPAIDQALMSEAAARIETLERALHQIIRMKTVPNDGINTFTLAAVHHVAETALSPQPAPPRIACIAHE